jgi:hypothetical protein
MASGEQRGDMPHQCRSSVMEGDADQPLLDGLRENDEPLEPGEGHHGLNERTSSLIDREAERHSVDCLPDWPVSDCVIHPDFFIQEGACRDPPFKNLDRTNEPAAEDVIPRKGCALRFEVLRVSRVWNRLPP